ncbi:hypothetical protein ACIBBB_00330 [Streptomyces sp. NPDC051217]|uniref:hypothetical protein n=1 Tax=Streptomyces sp. NPDC051217 TaxID=3365644 RepID=UPI00379FF054
MAAVRDTTRRAAVAITTAAILAAVRASGPAPRTSCSGSSRNDNRRTAARRTTTGDPGVGRYVSHARVPGPRHTRGQGPYDRPAVRVTEGGRLRSG